MDYVAIAEAWKRIAREEGTMDPDLRKITIKEMLDGLVNAGLVSTSTARALVDGLHYDEFVDAEQAYRRILEGD